MRPLFATLLLTLLLVVPQSRSAAGTITIVADRDATIIEDPAFANGSGPNIFAGRNNQAQSSIRRALVRFDVKRALPPNALVDGVQLTLDMLPSNPAPHVIEIYRVLADWGEGPSSSSGGQGAPSGPGDVTWLHRFHDQELWAYPGCQRVARPSIRLLVGEAGTYTWPSSLHMIQDVVGWLRAPDRNFGWVVIGDESLPQTVKSFASREHPEMALRPRLVVTYQLPGEH